MNLFSFFSKKFGNASDTQDANLPLRITMKSVITLEMNPLMLAITQGALLNVPLDNLKMRKVKAISSIVLDGLDDKKIYRVYFNDEVDDSQRFFLQILCDKDNPHAVDEILVCTSFTEPPANEDDIAFFMGENDEGLGESRYAFSRDDLTFFLPEQEVAKRLSATEEMDGVEYQRIDANEDFMPAMTGVETVIFDAQGQTGCYNQIENFMAHSRALQGAITEELIVAFWVTTSKNGEEMSLGEQRPFAEYIFAIKLEQSNIKVI